MICEICCKNLKYYAESKSKGGAIFMCIKGHKFVHEYCKTLKYLPTLPIDTVIVSKELIKLNIDPSR